MNEAPLDTKTETAVECASQAWACAARGQIEVARSLYRAADELWSEGTMDPGLSLLRHVEGSAIGHMTPPPFDEDSVVAFWVGDAEQTFDESAGEENPIDAGALERNIAAMVEHFPATFAETHHAKNIRRHLPHVQVLSTGRCGTVSVYRMLQGSNVQPYHNFWYMPSREACWEAAHAALAGVAFDPGLYLATRAAEWLSCISQDRAMIGLNHMDTAFAPVFAALHPESRFVYLRRDPLAVFTSFYAKKQWMDNQLRPLKAAFNPFRYRETSRDEVECLAWFIHFTEVFSRAFGRVLGERWIEISADKLFERDDEEISCLLDHCGAKVANPHASLAKPKNVKAHKVARSEGEVAAGQERFLAALTRLRETGTL